MMRMAPEGWYYAEAFIDANPETGAPADILVMGVCSDECRDKFWKKGPGRMTTATEKEKDPVEPEQTPPRVL
jgi:hypothetical protein